MRIDDFLEVLEFYHGADLHLAEGQRPCIRQQERVMPIREKVLSHQEIISLMTSLAYPEEWQTLNMCGDLDFTTQVLGGMRFRCNFYKHFNGYGAVLRKIPGEIMTIAELGLPMVVRSFANFKSGLVLISGPTGSGKTTTLAALVDHINQHFHKHIITFETNTEFYHKHKQSILTLREVGRDTPTFATGLKTALREDPDVLVVGDIRDIDTLQLMLKAADMGVLVFGTLQTGGVAKTLDRLIQMFPPDQQAQGRNQLSHVLRGVHCQFLLKRRDKNGLIPASEILVANPSVTEIIQEGEFSKLNDIMKMGSQHGMKLMDDSIFALWDSGAVEAEEAYLYSVHKERFVSYLKKESE